jgi:hypothetical protein
MKQTNLMLTGSFENEEPVVYIRRAVPTLCGVDRDPIPT